MKGVRLLVSEEMKPGISLDEAFIKRIAGGEGVRIEGRSCDTGNSSDFMWQAGVVLVFNEGDCPKFDGLPTYVPQFMHHLNLRYYYLLYKNVGRLKNFESFDKIFR